MASSSRRTRIVIIVLILLALLALLLVRCRRVEPAPKPPVATTVAPAPVAPAGAPSAAPTTAVVPAEDKLTPATLEVAPAIGAGRNFPVKWTGPENPGDFVAITTPEAPDEKYGSYSYIKTGNPVQLLAPIDAGKYEVRYVTGRAHRVVGRAPVEITANQASIQAPAQVVAGTRVKLTWTGPNNSGDFITLVPRTVADGTYGNYTYTKEGSELAVLAPMETGAAELRYMTGQGSKILARTPVTIVPADVSVQAPAQAVAGSKVTITWTGPNNSGDFITVVPRSTADGEYGNYTYTKAGEKLEVLTPIEPGECEVRYVAGQGSKVLARAPITIAAADVSVHAPARVIAGTRVAITWKGPSNGGDFITLVPRALADDNHGNYTYTREGAGLEVLVPMDPGEAEVRYISGQGNKLLARAPLTIVAAEVTLDGPATATAGAKVTVQWTGPGNSGDYVTIVPQSLPDGQYAAYVYTRSGPSLTIAAPAAGPAEIRYVSGQGTRTLARRPILILP